MAVVDLVQPQIWGLAVVASSSRTERSSRAAKALLLSPIVILFASATRLIIIANYDTTTATTIASSAGAISTLLGTVVPLLPLFLPALFIVLIIFRRLALAFLTALAAGFVSPAYTDVIDGLGQAFTTITNIWRRLDVWPRVDDINLAVGAIKRSAAFILRTIGPTDNSQQQLLAVWNEWTWVFICAAAGLIMIFVNPPRLLRRPDSSNTIRLTDEKPSLLKGFFGWVWRWPIGRGLSSLAVVLACAYSVLLVDTIYRVPFNGGLVSDILRRPWLPAEEVQVSSSDDPLVGYVLSTIDGWHVLLQEKTRQITYIKSADVIARTVCRIEQPNRFHDPLIKLQGVNPTRTYTCDP